MMLLLPGAADMLLFVMPAAFMPLRAASALIRYFFSLAVTFIRFFMLMLLLFFFSLPFMLRCCRNAADAHKDFHAMARFAKMPCHARLPCCYYYVDGAPC